MAIIFNGRECYSRYLTKDNIVIEINTLIDNIDDFFDKVRTNTLNKDEAIITGYKANDGQVETVDKYISNHYQSNLNLILNTDGFEVEAEAAIPKRPEILIGYEQHHQFRQYKNYVFDDTPIEITNDMLITQLKAAMGIVPNIPIEGKSIKELQTISKYANRLYWSVLGWDKTKFPSTEAINCYANLTDYEKRIINESNQNPEKLIAIAMKLKQKGPYTFNKLHERLAYTYNVDMAVELSTNPAFMVDTLKQIDIDDMSDTWLENISSRTRTGQAKFNLHIESNILSFSDKNITKALKLLKYIDELPEDKREERGSFLPAIFNNTFTENITAHALNDPQKIRFYTELAKEYVIPKNILETEYADYDLFLNALSREYNNMYNALENKNLSDEELAKYAKKAYYNPENQNITRLKELFIPVYRRAPGIVNEYFYAQCYKRGLNPETKISDIELQKMVDGWKLSNAQVQTDIKDINGKNATIATSKNIALLAFLDEFNYQELKNDLINVMASNISPAEINILAKKGFVEWIKANKDMNTTELAEVLKLSWQVDKFNKTDTPTDIIYKIKNKKGFEDCKKYEQSYNYKFADNDIAIKGRHLVVEMGKMKMYMLPADDLRNFTTGIDTNCCQRYGGAGGSCVWKLTSDPFAANVVVEQNGKIMAQSFVWVDVSKDCFVYDNIEFANNDKFNTAILPLIGAYTKELPYSNVQLGMGYTCLNGAAGFGKSGFSSDLYCTMPTTTDPSQRHVYSDYHTGGTGGSSARTLKTNGILEIPSKFVASNVKVTNKPDEPTKWDILTNPAVAFLLNDNSLGVQEKIEYAQRFLDNPDEALQLQAVTKSLDAIKGIEHPSKEVQLYVVNHNKDYAKYIQDPCEEVSILLIRDNPKYIKHISNPTDEMCLECLRKNGLLLKDIPQNRWTNEMIWTALEQNSRIIEIIPNPSPELITASVKNNPKILLLLLRKRINIPDEAYKAVLKHKDAKLILRNINLPENMQRYAIVQDPYLINEIKNPSYNLIKLAVEKNGLTYKNYMNLYPDLKSIAINSNPYIIRDLMKTNFITVDDIVQAVRKNRAVLNCIYDNSLRNEVISIISTPERAERFTDEIDNSL